MTENVNMQAAAIVCRDIAIDHVPILYAARSEPDQEEDSGWQFLCGGQVEDPKAAQVWALHEVLTYDPSLRPFVALPSGTVLTRASPNSTWVVQAAR